jgi:hypothetical protein
MGIGISNNKSSAFDDLLEIVIYKNLLSYISVISKLKFPFFKPVLLTREESFEFNGLDNLTTIQIDGEVVSGVKSSRYRISKSGTINLLT